MKEIKEPFDGDVFFPDFCEKEYVEVFRTSHHDIDRSSGNPISYDIIDYIKS